MQKSSNGKNVTLVSTAKKRLAAKSLRLTIKMTKIPVAGNPMAESQATQGLSLKNMAVKILLEKYVCKNSESNYVT